MTKALGPIRRYLQIAAASALTSSGFAQCPGIVPAIGWYNTGSTYVFEDRTDHLGIVATDPVWNFGDGGTADTFNAEHVYGEAGLHIVTFTQTVMGCPFQIQATVAHGGDTEPCYAPLTSSFSVEPGMNNQPGFADASTGGPLVYYWNFGDGTTDMAAYPTHFFQIPGAYDVTHSVASLDTSQGTCLAGSASRVYVDGNISTCDSSLFLYVGADALAGLGQFDIQVLPMDTDLIVWVQYCDYGDGITDYWVVPSATHEYVNPGTYQACVHVSAFNEATQDSCHASACSTLQIEVAIGGIPDAEASPALIAHPVPCENVLFVEGPAVQPSSPWSMVDALGRVKLQGSVTRGERLQVVTESLSPGCYVLVLSDGMTRHAVRVIKR